MRVDGRDITVSGSLLQPLTRRTNDILRLVLAAVFLAAVITSSLITRIRVGRTRKVHLRDRRSLDAHPVQSGVSGVRRRDSGAAVRDPDRLDRLAAVEAARGVRGGRVHRVYLALDHRQRHSRAEMAFRFVRSARHASLAVPRRPPVDRDARRRAHRFRPLAALALEAVVVDAAACLRADPPRRQRGGTRPLAAGPCSRLVRRRAGCARGRDACPRGAARRRRSRPGPAWIRGVGTDAWCAPPGQGRWCSRRTSRRAGFGGRRRDVRP